MLCERGCDLDSGNREFELSVEAEGGCRSVHLPTYALSRWPCYIDSRAGAKKASLTANSCSSVTFVCRRRFVYRLGTAQKIKQSLHKHSSLPHLSQPPTQCELQLGNNCSFRGFLNRCSVIALCRDSRLRQTSKRSRLSNTYSKEFVFLN